MLLLHVSGGVGGLLARSRLRPPRNSNTGSVRLIAASFRNSRPKSNTKVFPSSCADICVFGAFGLGGESGGDTGSGLASRHHGVTARPGRSGSEKDSESALFRRFGDRGDESGSDTVPVTHMTFMSARASLSGHL